MRLPRNQFPLAPDRGVEIGNNYAEQSNRWKLDCREALQKPFVLQERRRVGATGEALWPLESSIFFLNHINPTNWNVNHFFTHMLYAECSQGAA